VKKSTDKEKLEVLTAYQHVLLLLLQVISAIGKDKKSRMILGLRTIFDK